MSPVRRRGSDGFRFHSGLIIGLALPEICPGDCNGDGIVDLADFHLLEPCLFGPGNGPGAGCDCFDLDADDDVDERDLATFQVNFTGN